MTQQYLLSVESRSLSIVKIVMMSNWEAFEIYKNTRWVETDGKPVSTYWGGVDKHYFLKVRM